MAEFSIDRFVDRYARRAVGMTASEVRALFAVAARPEVVSLAGGMPFVQALRLSRVDGYLAPEQKSQEEFDGRVDFYGVGVIIGGFMGVVDMLVGG